MRVAGYWMPSRERLSSGRAQCSAVSYKSQIVVVGGEQASSPGEIIRFHEKNLVLPGCSEGSNGTAACCAVILRDRYLYKTFRHYSNGHDSIYVADLNQVESLWSNLMNMFFSSFWKRVTHVDSCDAALVSDGTSNRIYAVGGYVKTSSRGGAFSFLFNTDTVTRSVRCFHVENNNTQWLRLADMKEARRDLAIVIVNNYLYAIGGRDQSGKTLKSVERLDLSMSGGDYASWERVAPMRKGRYSFSATVVRGRYIVVVGGCCNHNRIGNVEYFDVCHPEWRSMPALGEERMNCSLSVQGSKLVIAGGTTGWGIVPLDSIETLEILHADPLPMNLPGSASSLPSAPPGPPPTVPSPPPPVVVEASSAPFALAVPVTAIPAADASTSTEEDNGGPSSSCYVSPSSQAAASIPIVQASAPPFEEVHHPMTAQPMATGQYAPAPAPATTRHIEDDRLCVICLERAKQVAFYCGHQVCLECSPLLVECHSCRRPIQGRIQLFD